MDENNTDSVRSGWATGPNQVFWGVLLFSESKLSSDFFKLRVDSEFKWSHRNPTHLYTSLLPTHVDMCRCIASIFCVHSVLCAQHSWKEINHILEAIFFFFKQWQQYIAYFACRNCDLTSDPGLKLLCIPRYLSNSFILTGLVLCQLLILHLGARYFTHQSKGVYVCNYK